MRNQVKFICLGILSVLVVAGMLTAADIGSLMASVPHKIHVINGSEIEQHKRSGRGYDQENDVSDSQNSNTMRRVIKGIEDFDAISASGRIHILYTQGNPGDIIIEGNEQTAQQVNISCKKGELQIHRKVKSDCDNNTPVIVKCSSMQLKKIGLSSACSLKSETALNSTGTFCLEMTSAARIDIPKLTADNLTLMSSSAAVSKISSLKVSSFVAELSSAAKADITLASVSTSAEVTLSSASYLNIVRLTCTSLNLCTSSASTCRLGDVNSNDVSIETSSSSTLSISGLLNCNNTKPISIEASSASTIDIASIRGKNAVIETMSQGNVNLRNILLSTLHLEAYSSKVFLHGIADTAYIEAGPLTVIDGNGFDVEVANVEANRSAKITIKAGKVNYK